MSFELILPFLRPIEPLLLDDSISEIMGNPDASWWYERDGNHAPGRAVSFDAGRLRTGLEVIANQLGKKLDEDNPVAARAASGRKPAGGGDSTGRAAFPRADHSEVHQPPLHRR